MKSLVQFLQEKKNILFPHQEKKNHTFAQTDGWDADNAHKRILMHQFPDHQVKKLGAGAFGAAYSLHQNDHEENGHQVVKISKQYMDRDSYINHIRASASLSDANPHLPRISSITHYNFKDNDSYNVTEMERLHSLHSLNPKEIDATHNHAFPKSKFKEGISYFKMANKVEDLTKKYIYGDKDFSKNAGESPEMRKATKHVASTIQKKGGAIDLHSGNVMVRKTHVGPQLVLTDPIA